MQTTVPTGATTGALSPVATTFLGKYTPRPNISGGMAMDMSDFSFDSIDGIALFSATGDVPRAEQEHRDFLRAEKGITSEMASAGGVLSETVRRVADHVMSARIARAKGDAKSEIELLRKGVEIEDSVGYDEPPAWYLPTRESLGGALLRNGHYAEAERVFRADLERNRRNGRSLFGLMGALTSQNRLYEAALVRQEFESAWRHADTPLRLEDL